MLELMTTVWFWVAVVVFFIGLMICEASEKGFGSLLLYAAAAASLHFFGVDVLGFLKDNAGTIILFVVLYVVCGMVWACVKWYLFAAQQGREYAEAKAKCWEQCKDDPPEEIEIEWEIRCRSMYSEYNFPPKATHYKSKIAHWISNWFTSMIWTLLSDVLTNFFENIVKAFQGTFQKISDKAFASHSQK